MLTVSGLLIIPKDEKVQEYQIPNGVYFNFTAVGKNPYKEGREYYKLSVFAATKDAELARENLVPGKSFLLRMGELTGKKLESGSVFNTVSSRWNWVEPTKVAPGPERKDELK